MEPDYENMSSQELKEFQNAEMAYEIRTWEAKLAFAVVLTLLSAAVGIHFIQLIAPAWAIVISFLVSLFGIGFSVRCYNFRKISITVYNCMQGFFQENGI